MKFGKTLIKNEVVDTDRRWPFFAILLIVQQIKKNVFKLLFSCPLGAWVLLWNFETIRWYLMRPRKFAHSCFSSLVLSLLLKDNLFKNTFDFTTVGDWDYMAVVERNPALQYSVDFIFLSFEIMGFIVELKNY